MKSHVWNGKPLPGCRMYQLQFMIEHPAEWIVNEEKPGPILQIQFLSPSETNRELFENRLIVEGKALSVHNTLDDYVHSYTNQSYEEDPKVT